MSEKASQTTCGVCDCQIKENTFFADLTDEQVSAFKGLIGTTSHKKREVIFMEGDDCTGMYIVRAGRVKLVRSSRAGKEQIISILSPGGILGLELFYNGAAYANTAVAMEPSELCYVAKDSFFEILKSEPDISAKLIMSLGKELDSCYERIGNLGLMNAREKIAHLLCSLSKEYGVSDGDDIRLHLTLSRLEIAELLGITQETSIRLLKSFKEMGVIDIKRKEIIIKSIDKLKEMGGIFDEA